MKFVILLFSALFMSACATHEFSKSKYSNNPNYDWSGGVLHYGQSRNYNEDKITSLITDFCQNRSFKKTSIENDIQFEWIFWPFGFFKDRKLEFECINEKK